jgi:hypothetical protein
MNPGNTHYGDIKPDIHLGELISHDKIFPTGSEESFGFIETIKDVMDCFFIHLLIASHAGSVNTV